MDKTRSTLLMRFVDISLKNKLLMSLYVVAIGFLLSTLLLLMVGKSPMVMYNAIFQNITGYDLTRHRFNARYIGNWLMLSMPLVLTGLSLNFAFRSGFLISVLRGNSLWGSRLRNTLLLSCLL